MNLRYEPPDGAPSKIIAVRRLGRSGRLNEFRARQKELIGYKRCKKKCTIKLHRTEAFYTALLEFPEAWNGSV